MAHSNSSRVRIIKSQQLDRSWDDGWLRPLLAWLNTTRMRLAPAWSAMLTRWSGVAGMIGGLLWAAVAFVNFLRSFEIYTLLGYPSSVNTLYYLIYSHVQGLYLIQYLPLMLFLVTLLGIYRYEPVRTSRLGKLGFVLSFLGLGLMILGPPVVYWLDYTWLNRSIANILFGGLTDIYLSEGSFSNAIGLDVLMIGLILLGISSLRGKLFPTVVMLGLSASSFGLLLPTIVEFSLFLGNIAFRLPTPVIYDFHNRLDDYGVSPLRSYLSGLSWIGLGYALHSQARRTHSHEIG